MKLLGNAKATFATFLLCTLTFAGDTRVEAPDFTVEIVLSEQARTYLVSHSEAVAIDISFADFIGPGWNYLGGMKRELSPDSSTSLNIRDIGFDSKRTAALKTPNYEVLVNVSSARRSFDMNILDCDLLQAHIVDVQRKIHTLRCELGKSAPK